MGGGEYEEDDVAVKSSWPMRASLVGIEVMSKCGAGAVWAGPLSERQFGGGDWLPLCVPHRINDG